jgi:hypothetical protein
VLREDEIGIAGWFGYFAAACFQAVRLRMNTRN